MERVEELASRAMEVRDFLAPHCERIDIAGSLRRGSVDVEDIDIVLIPTMFERIDMFGYRTSEYHSLTDQFSELAEEFGLHAVRGGDRMRVFHDHEYNCSIDIFIVLPPAQYGALLAIRTGPAAFSHLCMTSRLDGGAMPPGMRQQDGALWRGITLIETPTEADWMKALEIPYWPPAERSAKKLGSYLNQRKVTRS